MKYWWLEKYKNLKVVDLKELTEDVFYFLTMPKNYQEKVEEIKKKELSILTEEEILILLYHLIETKNIKDQTLRLVIEKLLIYPDNSFPSSDYTLLEMLEEIKNLKNNPPLQEKLNHNNIAICYHCFQIYYVDKIKNTNRNGYCICPYCHSTKIYFDNDYIPMNYLFLKLAYFYYHISGLGCRFREIQKLLKKNVKIEIGKKEKESIIFSKWITNQKPKPIDEKKIYRNLILSFQEKENLFLEKSSIFVSNAIKSKENLFLLILICIMETLANTIYIKEIKIIFEQEEDYQTFSSMLKVIQKFH